MNYFGVIMKRMLLILITALIAIGTCGCGMREQAKIDRMLEYVNSKYADDSFDFVKVTGGHLGSDTKYIIVRSEEYPEIEFQVMCSEVDGEEIFSDSYLAFKFEDQIYKYLLDLISEAYGENIFFSFESDVSDCMQTGSGDTTFEDYIKSAGNCVFFYAVVTGDAADEEKEVKKIEDTLSGIVASARIYFVNTSEDLSKQGADYIEQKNFEKMIYFVKSSVSEYSYIEWVDGE